MNRGLLKLYVTVRQIYLSSQMNCIENTICDCPLLVSDHVCNWYIIHTLIPVLPIICVFVTVIGYALNFTISIAVDFLFLLLIDPNFYLDSFSSSSTSIFLFCSISPMSFGKSILNISKTDQ